MPDNTIHPAEIVTNIRQEFDLPAGAPGNLHDNLSKAINRLILQDFNFLINALYRLDISEKKVKDVLKTTSNHDAGDLIAGLIIERQLEKLRARGLFNNQEDIPDEEKW
ncbi:MAG TPA: hypothetical protein VK616_15680 [Flavitalea sp.]|nr:hypothetical protein [Flavitalea sp.]